MNKKSKWLLVVSLATMVTGSGMVMAATNNADQQQGNPEGRGKRPPMACHMGPGMMKDHTALLNLLNIDEATLRSECAAGKTLGQIAGEHGVAEQAVIELVKEQMTARIDADVKAGRLTAEQGKQMKAGASQRAEQMVKRGPGAPGGPMGHRGPGMIKDTALLNLLNIDEATLRSECAAGKTLSQIAAEHGVAEQAVINLVKEEMITHIEQGVKDGCLSAEQGEQMKADAAQKAEQMVKNGPGVPGGPRGHHRGPGKLAKAAPEK